MSPKPSIAFIGTGVMGRSMAGHLLTAGHPVHVFNRTKGKAAPLLERGAQWHASAGDAAASAEVVITMLGFPHDVEQTYLGKGGVIERARPGALLVDMTTSSPLLAQKVFAAASARGLDALDAPVSGGDIGAREARLVIMVGGGEAAFERARPVFSLMGKNIALQGPAGAGQHCKMANQIACAVGMVAWVRRSPTRSARDWTRRGSRGASAGAPPAAGPSPTSGRARSRGTSRRDST
jgi:3-hydroxyisobutyrate dehydrogenase